MIRTRIKDFRNIEQASLDIKPNNTYVIFGRNGAGKSSFLRGVGIAATQAIPTSKTKAKDGIREGAKTATVTIIADEKETTWNLKENAIKGGSFTISPIAAGLSSLVKIGTVEARFKLLDSILKPKVTFEAFAKACEGLADRVIKQAWEDLYSEELKIFSWQECNKQWREEAQVAKRLWCEVTNSRAFSETPTEFNSYDPAVKLEDLEKELAGMSDKYSKEREEARDYTYKKSTYEASIERGVKAKEQYALLKPLMEELRKTCSKIGGDVVKCVHCDKEQFSEGDKLSPIPDGAEYVPTKEWNKARRELDFLEARVKELATEVTEGKAAKEQLVALKEVKAPTVDDNLVERSIALTKLIDIHKKQAKADELHAEAMKYLKLIDVSDAKGLRAQALEESINNFNGYMANFCAQAQWGKVEINPTDASVTYDGADYDGLNDPSDGQKFRVRATLQVATANYINDRLVLIDIVEFIDDDAKNGLLDLCAMSTAPCVIACTVQEMEEVPPLAELGLGQAYWMENGVLTDLNKVAAPA